MSEELLERLTRRDTTLWPEGNVAANRLGWLDVAEAMRAQVEDLQAWAATVTASKVVLLGMGGSSLGPEVLRAAVGDERLVVMDTTDPATVAALDLDDAFFLVSSKSGGTLEVRALLAYCWDRVGDGSRYAAITDPGTELSALASERGFSRTFENPPDIGGRYSVLSYFGLVPAALLGYDLTTLLDRAAVVDRAEAVRFGVAMAEAAREGRDKVTIHIPEGPMSSLGLWCEQLLAESTGKLGTGLVPVPTAEREDGPDRHHVEVSVTDPLDLGAEFLRWELATAAAGHVLGVDPFDEPNVTESKEHTAAVLDKLAEGMPPVPTVGPTEALRWLRSVVREGDYVSLQAYMPYGQGPALDLARRRVRDALGGMAVTAGFGPRFLHSTGQLHKGGPNNVVAVQIVPSKPTAEIPIPGFRYDFATLITAQSVGDYLVLDNHRRRVLRVAVENVAEVGSE